MTPEPSSAGTVSPLSETYRPPSLRLLLLVLLAGVVVAGLTALLSADPRRPTSPSGAELPPSLVNDAEIQREVPRSPRRVVLEWSRSVQYSDLAAVAQFTSKAATKAFGGRAKQDSAVNLVGPTFGRVSLLNVRSDAPGKATVRAVLNDYDFDGKKLRSTGVTFEMTKTGRQWQVDDLALLKRLAREASPADRS